MLTQIADRVLVHESDFLQSNSVVVKGETGVLLIDPGITNGDLSCLADDLREQQLVVVAGFATHPHWDHVLWHRAFGDAPRYGTYGCAATIRDLLSNAGWQSQVAEVLPPDIAGEIPLDLFGLITGLPTGASELPWDGPTVRLMEHAAHARGHAALLIDDRRVLVAGDMLSDSLIPFLDLGARDPIEDYLDALRLVEGVADRVEVVIPGHGSIGDAHEVRLRIDQDRAYLESLRDGRGYADPRLERSATHGEWLPGVHDWQQQQVAQRPPS